MGLGALGELQMLSRKQTADHILASCPLCHPPKGTLGLVDLDDDTVNWLQRTALSIDDVKLVKRRKIWAS